MKKLLLVLFIAISGSAIGQTPTMTPVEINKRPLLDFKRNVAEKAGSKEVDFDKNFSITLNAVLTKDGKFDRSKSKFDIAKQTGDPKMIRIGQEALEAIGDSGFFTYLANLGAESFTAVLGQDDKTFEFVITSPQKTPERKNIIVSSLSGIISISKMKAELPSDERTILDGLTATGDGVNIVLKLTLPKTVAQEIFARKVNQTRNEKSQQR